MPAPLFDWLRERGAGVLLHPTSLPGNQGVGVLDGTVERFLDFLGAAGMKYWQLCPLGPTGFGDSPYQCFSAFAGNPYLIDLRDLEAKGFLKGGEIGAVEALGSGPVDFGGLYRVKWGLLKKAYERWKADGEPSLGGESFEDFKARHALWLEPYALFRALKERYEGRSWLEWPAESRRTSGVKPAVRKTADGEVNAQRFYQYVFFTQWARVRKAARSRGISIIGDIPIFVAGDSADVWANPELFELDGATGRPLAVAGVPPDYFSADGQLWGNPLYAWQRHRADGYAWWKNRFKAAFALYDVVRIDHFRGFDEYWRIPLPAETAKVGAWMPGPGLEFFAAMRAAFPEARIIAEDLGVLTPTVVKLREESGLPGMAVLQFAFGDTAKNAYLPHNGIGNSVIYPGTHDNDTTLGWYASTDEKTRDHVRRYLRVDGREAGWDMIRAAYGSVSRLAVVTMQDILSLGSEARFNFPGKPAGNWQWRCRWEQLERASGGTARYLAELGAMFGRV